MKVLSRKLAVLPLVLFPGFVQIGSGAEILVDTSTGFGQVGAFYGLYDPAHMPPAGYPPTLAPDNDPTFQNYFMGRSTFGSPATGTASPERRAFFMFDMAGVLASIPVGHTISAVTIDLELTPGGSAALANFSGGVEIVEFTGTPFDASEIIDPAGTGTSELDIWSSFGSSVPYGFFGIDGSGDEMMITPEGSHTIPLPGSISDVDMAIMGGGIFIVTAKLATFDPGPIGFGAPPIVDPYEYVFGITDVVSGSGSTVPAPLLTITTIPEPSGFLLILLGLSLALRRGRRG